jgi:hypothetical protein
MNCFEHIKEVCSIEEHLTELIDQLLDNYDKNPKRIDLLKNLVSLKEETKELQKQFENYQKNLLEVS